jgi:hypothetical protein
MWLKLKSGTCGRAWVIYTPVEGDGMLWEELELEAVKLDGGHQA